MNKMIKKKGITLFELLVSISIIGILTALAVVSYGSMQKKARDARRVQDMAAIQKAAEQFYMLNSSKYCSGTGMTWSAGQTWTINSQVVMQSTPQDPKGLSNPYNYRQCDPLTYCICATLESATGNSSDFNCTGWVAGTGAYYCVNNQQ